MNQTELLTVPKYYECQKPDISYEIINSGETTELLFKSDCFAKSVFVDFKDFDCVMSDNYFDITNKNGYKVDLLKKYTDEEIKNNITVKSVYDIGV